MGRIINNTFRGMVSVARVLRILFRIKFRFPYHINMGSGIIPINFLRKDSVTASILSDTLCTRQISSNAVTLEREELVIAVIYSLISRSLCIILFLPGVHEPIYHPKRMSGSRSPFLRSR